MSKNYFELQTKYKIPTLTDQEEFSQELAKPTEPRSQTPTVEPESEAEREFETDFNSNN